MNRQHIEQKIRFACEDWYNKRDWTRKEKEFIITNKQIQASLFPWYDSRISDGCWTEASISFLELLRQEIN